MSEYNQNVYSSGRTLQQYMTSVYLTMGAGLGITALVAGLGYLNLMNGGWVYSLLASGAYYIAALVTFAVQIGICIALSHGLTTMSQNKAKTLFYVYAAITGFTFTTLPLAFGTATVFTAFLFAAVMYFAAAVIGHYTSVDLSKFSGILIGALFAMVLVSVLAMFIPALADSLIVSYIGVLLFMGLTAWDTQRIKQFYYGTAGNDTLSGNLAIYGAFELYLDFINLFLYILRIFGARSSRN